MTVLKSLAPSIWELLITTNDIYKIGLITKTVSYIYRLYYIYLKGPLSPGDCSAIIAFCVQVIPEGFHGDML